MADAALDQDPHDRLEELIEVGDPRAVRAFVDALAPVDTVRAVLQLREGERARLFDMLRTTAVADVLGHIPDELAGGALESMEPRRAAAILAELPSAEGADLIGALDTHGAETILAHMEPGEAHELRQLAAYEGTSAGGLMIREFAHVRSGSTVLHVVEHLREHAEDLHLYGQYVYVVDERDRLVGSLPLSDLLLAPHAREVDAVMDRQPRSVRVDATLDELAGFFDREHVYGVPVVDAKGGLVGLLRRAAVQEALAEVSEQDFRASQGIVGGEELRSMPLTLRSRRRLSWLSVNVLLNLVAASVIAMHQDTLQAVIALAVFLPIISDMSGCSGNQAVAVSMRELTLGVARPSDLGRVLLAEARVGVVNGLALGLLLGAVAWLWKGSPWLGLVVGAALALNTLIAVCVGGGVPLLLKRLGRDPALASGPILTTITDLCGFFLVLSMAARVLDRLA